jgi:hypothetical protein
MCAWLSVPVLFAAPLRVSVAGAPGQMAGPSGPVQIAIPGPLKPFLRMAAISQKAAPDEILPFVARNVVTGGYRFGPDGSRKPSEYLILLTAYLKQARELTSLAGAGGEIRISSCTDAAPLLQILGYRMRQPCGPGATLETLDAKRAFLTLDSGFPLVDLEDALRVGKPFTYAFGSSSVPVLFSPGDWSQNGVNVLDSLLRDPELSRLYWSLARLDQNTRAALQQAPGLRKLMSLASVLDFYGSQIYLRSGRVAVPGGAKAEPAWKSLVGAGPESPTEFMVRLMQKDSGWLAAYFDTLSRIPRAQQDYFTEPRRLVRFYEALHSRSLPKSAGSSFRPAPRLMILAGRLQLDADGRPHVPGGLDVWKEILRRRNSRAVRDWARRASSWKDPEQVIEAMVGMSKMYEEDNPVELFSVLSEIDRRRLPHSALSASAVRLLAENFSRFGSQYSLFTEWSALDDTSIARFLEIAREIDAISDPVMRADAIGLYQANTGLWQILARQDENIVRNANDSFQKILAPFSGIRTSAQLLQAAEQSLEELCRSAAGRGRLSQDEMLALLAGPDQGGPVEQQVRQNLANRMRAVLSDQRLVSLDTLFELADGLDRVAEGRSLAPESLMRLVGELRDFEVPRPIFTRSERNAWAGDVLTDRHLTRQIELSRLLQQPANAFKQLGQARSLLASCLRDTLVGLNYAYYEPPGAHMLHHNSVFVRSHDFAERSTGSRGQPWRTPRLAGVGVTAGGGAHLEGSLADLPYVLSKVEQDFIVPENIQALIWSDLVPELLTSAVLPRWWRVTPQELHAVALYQKAGDELVTSASGDSALRPKVLAILADRLFPQRQENVTEDLDYGNIGEALSELMPAETFYLTAEFRKRYPGEASGPAGQELEALSREYPEETSRERISRDFGIPHPALGYTYAREMFDLKPLPAFLGYSSRLLAESWESNNLYWGRLADESGQLPVSLHSLVPLLTHRMVEKLFATHQEDWPAVLRALRETGDEFRRGELRLPAQAGERVSGQSDRNLH